MNTLIYKKKINILSFRRKVFLNICIALFMATLAACEKVQNNNLVLAPKNEYHQVNKTISVTDFGDGKKDSLDLDEDGKTDMYFLLAGSETENFSKISTTGQTYVSGNAFVMYGGKFFPVVQTFILNEKITDSTSVSMEKMLHKNAQIDSAGASEHLGAGIGGRGNVYLNFIINKKIGWIRLHLSQNNKELVIVDYAYSKFENQPVYAGQH
ncbi:MAG: hypothetical protein U0U67_15455 [Chitinophagales bacterium]